jgi:hypothetical protein
LAVERSSIVLGLLLAVSCTADDSTIRSFYSTIAPGTPLVGLVLRAEQAQKPDVQFTVAGVSCPDDAIEIGRTYGNPYIRVTHKPRTSEPSAEPGHAEVGYASRHDFERALSTRLPPFFRCARFVFRFGRDQVWPTTDSFAVDVNEEGTVTAISELKKDDLGE